MMLLRIHFQESSGSDVIDCHNFYTASGGMGLGLP